MHSGVLGRPAVASIDWDISARCCCCCCSNTTRRSSKITQSRCEHLFYIRILWTAATSASWRNHRLVLRWGKAQHSCILPCLYLDVLSKHSMSNTSLCCGSMMWRQRAQQWAAYSTPPADFFSPPPPPNHIMLLCCSAYTTFPMYSIHHSTVKSRLPTQEIQTFWLQRVRALS